LENDGISSQDAGDDKSNIRMYQRDDAQLTYLLKGSPSSASLSSDSDESSSSGRGGSDSGDSGNEVESGVELDERRSGRDEEEEMDIDDFPVFASFEDDLANVGGPNVARTSSDGSEVMGERGEGDEVGGRRGE
jgi:hypothetical protein